MMAMDKIYHGQIKLGLIQRGVTVPPITTCRASLRLPVGFVLVNRAKKITLALGG